MGKRYQAFDNWTVQHIRGIERVWYSIIALLLILLITGVIQ